MAKALVLTAMTGSQIGKRYTLTGRTNVVGSAPGSDMVLHDRMIEPRHAEMRQMLESWFVVPLTSGGAGISVNGQPVKSQNRLKPGDRLTLGMTTYSVAMEELVEQEVGTPQSASSGAVPRLGDYFVRRGIMTPEQVQLTADRQAALERSGVMRPFGQIAHELGFINRTQLERAISEQRSDFNDRFHD